MAQGVEGPALSVMWHGFNSLAQEFPQVLGTAQKKREREREKDLEEWIGVMSRKAWDRVLQDLS